MLVDFLLGFLVGYFVSSLFMAILEWYSIQDWFSHNTKFFSRIGVVVRRELDNGNVRVVAGVFNQFNVLTASEVWEVNELGSDLEYQFGYSDQIHVTL